MLAERRTPWWRRLVAEARVPDYIPIRPAEARRCPECATGYDPLDKYCPQCHMAVPEWQYG
jgi:hypothetical protein